MSKMVKKNVDSHFLSFYDSEICHLIEIFVSLCLALSLSPPFLSVHKYLSVYISSVPSSPF